MTSNIMFTTSNLPLILVALMFSVVATTNAQQQFNYEVEKRILDRLGYYLGAPVAANLFLANYRDNGGFPFQLEAPDRDAYLVTGYSLAQPLLYYGLEDGVCVGYYSSNGKYREPGNGGYSITDESMQKHLKSCVDDQTGEPQDCLLAPGDYYIQCPDEGCDALELCPDDASQRDCSQLEFLEEQQDCKAEQKWCPKYTIETAPTDSETTGLGMVPMTNYCHDVHGHFTQELGVVLPVDASTSDEGLGNCYYGDGKTLVNRDLSGDYAYCGSNGESCDSTFAGGYESRDYDPRYRPWYIATKELQKPNWSPPYPFFELGIGVTYSYPFYNTENDGKQVFAGVLGIDYRFEDIVQFIVESYGNTSTTVVIYEDAEPNYIIGASTGSDTARNVLTSDLTQPCPVDSGNNALCTPVRARMADLTGHPMDRILVRAFERHEAAGYPQELLSVKASDNIDSELFISQSTLYEQSGAELKWRVIITSPGQQSDSDAITRDTPLFSAICGIGGLGLAVCALLFVGFYRKRKEKAVVYADWRFTCAFIFGCSLVNGSTFTLLGENTDSTCLLRMWFFHFFFVLALAPLFVKVWRMKQLVGSSSLRRKSISNTQAALYTLPMILTQVVILLIFTFVDPPQQAEQIENVDGVIVQSIVCETDTNAFFIVQIVFDGGFVVLGCILAYMTRNLDPKFGEAKQLIFAMYNIALVGVIILLVASVADMDQNGRSVLQAVGVLWGTVFSSAAFVLPRMMQVRNDERERQNNFRHGVVRVTGLHMNTGMTSLNESEKEIDQTEPPSKN